MATTQLASGRSPLDVQRQTGHTTLTMTNHYASLTVQQLQKSHEQHSPLRTKGEVKNEALIRVIGMRINVRFAEWLTTLRCVAHPRANNHLANKWSSSDVSGTNLK